MSQILNWLRISVLVTTVVMGVLFVGLTQRDAIHVPSLQEAVPALLYLLKLFPMFVAGFFLGQWLIYKMNARGIE